MSSTSEIRDNKFNNSTIDGKVQQQNVNISLDKVAEHMLESSKTEQNLTTEKLRNTNEELQKAKENYKAVTEKVQKVAIEHPVPETDNQMLHQIAGSVFRQEKDFQELKNMMNQDKSRDLFLYTGIGVLIGSFLIGFSQFKK